MRREKDIVKPDEWVFDFTIRDVYYNEDGKPKGYGADPQFACGEDFTGLLADFKTQAEALKKPVLFLCDVTEELHEKPTDGDWCYTPTLDTPMPDVSVPKKFKPDPVTMEEFENLKREMERVQAERDKIINDRIKYEQETFKAKMGRKVSDLF